MKNTVVAIDIGASSGRLINITFNDGKLTIQEIYRFDNQGIEVCDHLYWDILNIYHEIIRGLPLCFTNDDIISIGIDTWGVDFGLIDCKQELISNPYHYRDKQTNSMIEKADQIFGKKGLFDLTGVQDMWFNTTFQLLGMLERKASVLSVADKLLMMPDLIGFMLTGAINIEYTSAFTTQLYDWVNKTWNYTVINGIGLDAKLFPKIVATGTVKGFLHKQICKNLNSKRIPVICVAEHDSASAAIAVPTDNSEYLFVNSGTWSILGMILENPIINDNVFECGLSNEGAAFGKTKLVKNIPGMWLTQECRRIWKENGERTDFLYLDAEVEKSKSFNTLIDVEHEMFITPDNMLEAIDLYASMTNQSKPSTQGEYLRCICESLALKYKETIVDVQKVTQKNFPTIHLLGGASKDKIFCQFVANATNKTVLAGPVEATAIGNAFIQMISMKLIKDERCINKIVLDSFEIREYFPKNIGAWNMQYKKLKDIVISVQDT